MRPVALFSIAVLLLSGIAAAQGADAATRRNSGASPVSRQRSHASGQGQTGAHQSSHQSSRQTSHQGDDGLSAGDKALVAAYVQQAQGNPAASKNDVGAVRNSVIAVPHAPRLGRPHAAKNASNASLLGYKRHKSL